MSMYMYWVTKVGATVRHKNNLNGFLWRKLYHVGTPATFLVTITCTVRETPRGWTLEQWSTWSDHSSAVHRCTNREAKVQENLVDVVVVFCFGHFFRIVERCVEGEIWYRNTNTIGVPQLQKTAIQHVHSSLSVSSCSSTAGSIVVSKTPTRNTDLHMRVHLISMLNFPSNMKTISSLQFQELNLRFLKVHLSGKFEIVFYNSTYTICTNLVLRVSISSTHANLSMRSK